MSDSGSLLTSATRATLRMTMGARLPDYGRDQKVTGLHAPVRIRRDRWAIPHIEAETPADAWFALGYCQGQDRAFQLEIFLRVCRGTLAETVGKTGLRIDRISRRIGFRRQCDRQLAACLPEVQETFRAFARGVNAGARLGTAKPAHEFSLLRVARTDWQAEDAMAMVRFVAFIHAMSWDTQLARLRILERDGAEAVRVLEPHTPGDDPCSTPPGAPFGTEQLAQMADRLDAELKAFEQWLGKGGASNNWVIGKNRTRNGRTLVANDPHLDPSVPVQFYLAHLKAPGLHVAGAAFVGAPSIAAGHNGVGAWGVTNGKADGARLYLEHLSTKGDEAQLSDGSWEPCQVIEEKIRVRFGADVTERVVITKRGPVISASIEGENHRAISFSAHWLRPVPLRGFLTAHRATSFRSFVDEFEDFPCAILNLLYGDAETVGFRLVGPLPKRDSDYGYFPGKPGPESFKETLSFGDMPEFEGGPDDFVGTANNPPTPGRDARLGLHWTAGYRARRIYEELARGTEWDIDACLRLQLDVVSPVWREIRASVLGVSARDPYAREALTILSEWNGRLDPDSPGAAVFEAFLHGIGRRIVEVKAPNSALVALGESRHPISPFTNYAMQRFSHTSRLLREQPSDWFPRGWTTEIEAALANAARSLEDRLGTDRSLWSWGAYRPMTLKHLLGHIEPLASIYNIGPFAWGGDTTTLNMCTSHPLDPTAPPLVAATMRMAIEIGDWDGARFILAGGQSGNPLSPHYDDMFALWKRGDAVRLAWSDAAVEATAAYDMTLLPG